MTINGLSQSPRFSAPVQDGKVDLEARSGLANSPHAVTDIRDERVETVLDKFMKKDASALGEGWSVHYRDLPKYGHRGIEQMQQWTTFESESQSLEVSWHDKKLTLDTQAPDSDRGHRVEANFNWQRQLEPDSIKETYFLVE